MNEFHSQANQDEFVFNILNKKTDGMFVDIGSGDSVIDSNSYFLESVGWRGICVDIRKLDYSKRKCKFYNADALSLNYNTMFVDNEFPSIIDYLSLDIDDNTAKCLELIPLDKYQFKVITIEHDSYRLGHVLREQERFVLYKFGYCLICQDVTFNGLKPGEYFEDWWVNPVYVRDIEHIECTEEFSTNIIKKFVSSLAHTS